MIPEIICPPDGPVVGFSLTGEKFANCFACRRCGGCAHVAFVPELDFNYSIGHSPATKEGETQKALKTVGHGLRPSGVRK